MIQRRAVLVPGTGVFTTCTRTRAKTLAYAVGPTLLSLIDQSRTEILNANFISIVLSSTRIQCRPLRSSGIGSNSPPVEWARAVAVACHSSNQRGATYACIHTVHSENNERRGYFGALFKSERPYLAKSASLQCTRERVRRFRVNRRNVHCDTRVTRVTHATAGPTTNFRSRPMPAAPEN